MPKVLLKKQHFRQEASASCVPAAARIVLNYLGVAVKSEAYLRKIFKTKVTGTNILNLGYLKDEKEWNVDVKAEQGTLLELENYIEQEKSLLIVLVDTEFIEYWEFSTAHALVIVGFDDDHIIVNDPYLEDQELKIAKANFIQAWSSFQNLMIMIKKR